MHSLHGVHEMNACIADSVCLSILYTYFNCRTAAWILMKFGMDFMPLEATWNLDFLISYKWYYQHGKCTNLWGGSNTIAT
jgi:hypothetical protein